MRITCLEGLALDVWPCARQWETGSTNLAWWAVLSLHYWAGRAMRETGHQEELQSTAEIVLAWGKGLEREKDYYLAWIVQAITQGETLQQALKCLIARLLLWNSTFESLKFSSFLFSKFLFFYGGFSYLIPSGMTIFLPISPSTSRTNGKSDSKLLTVKRRFTKEVMRRWKKSNTLETNLFRHKKKSWTSLPLNAFSHNATQQQQRGGVRWRYR